MRLNTYLMRELFIHFEALPEPNLVTREFGTKAYDWLSQAILQADVGTVLVFDFSDVLVMDSSFAGPSLLRLMQELVEGQFGDRYIALSKATASTRENVDLTIRGHGLNLAIPYIDDAEMCLLGKIEPKLSDTFDLIEQRKTLTARGLADLENISIAAASNRLKGLYDLRLISRRKEVTTRGRHHEYQALLA